MFNDTILMQLSVDLLMCFVRTFADWTYHVVEFLLLWTQRKDNKIQSHLFVRSLNRKDFFAT